MNTIDRFFILVSLATLLACSGGTTSDAEVAMKVNGHEITTDDLELHARLSVQELAHQGREVPEAMAAVIRRRSIDTLVQMSLLEDAAKGAGIEVSDEEVKERIDGTIQALGSEDSFNAYLQDAGIPREYYESQTRRGLLIDKYVAQLTADLPPVTDAVVEAFYKENSDQFKHPERIRASHILVQVEEGATAEDKAAARKKAEEILKAARSGKDFAALAKEFSDCPSSSQGGDLSYFGRGEMVPPFSEAAFALKKDQISDIVETRFGYHIIKKTDHVQAGTVSLEETGERIREYLASNRQQTVVQERLAELREKAVIEYMDPSLDPANAPDPHAGMMMPGKEGGTETPEE